MKRTTPFDLLYPEIIRFGWGVRETLPDIVGRVTRARPVRVLPVVSRTVAASPAGRSVLSSVSTAGISPFVGVPHDPSLHCVEAIIEAVRGHEATVVVAVGGGSVIDAAKAAAALVPAGGPVVDYFRQKRKIESPGVPFVALPTTAGTGAEITKNSVLTDPEAGVKKSLRSPHMVPSAAIVDPEFTLGMAPGLTAASGLDALTQAIESYLSSAANTVSKSLAVSATQRLLEWLPRAYVDGDSAPARLCVAEGSLLSAMAFSQSGLGAVHGLAHPIGLALGLAHGVTCAVLLPHILRWNYPVCREELRQLATATGLPDATAFMERIDDLCRRFGIPETFAPWGFREAHFPAVLANCRSGSMKANPRPLSDRDICDLLEQLAAGGTQGKA